MMSNFDFLQTEWPDLHASARKAEALVHTDTRTSCFYARRTLELAIDWVYQKDSDLKRPYDNHLSALIFEPTFKDNLPKNIFLKVRAIKEIGNQAVHSNRAITETDALHERTLSFSLLAGALLHTSLNGRISGSQLRRSASAGAASFCSGSHL